MIEQKKRPDKRGNLTARDEKMLDLICRYHDLGVVAEELGIEEGTITSRLYWIRKKRKEWQRNIDILNKADRKCPRLKKLLATRELKR